MKPDYDTSWDYFEDLLQLSIPLQQKWHSLLSFYFSKDNNPTLLSLRAVDINSDLEEVNLWMQNLLNTEPLPENIIAFWIGIFKTIYEGEEIYATYCTGSSNFNPDNLDWTNNAEYQPENRYYSIDGMNSIAAIIKPIENFTFLDWLLPIAYNSFIFGAIITQNRLVQLSNLKIVCGYDDGDYVIIN